MAKRSPTEVSKQQGAPIIVDLDNPAVQACIEVDALMCWEELRQSRRAFTVQQLAEARQLPMADAQRILDRLVDASWVERLRAGGGRRSTTYRAAGDPLMIGWDPTSPDHRTIARRLAAAMRSASRQAIDSQQEASVRLRNLGTYFTFEGTRADAHKIMNEICDLATRIRQIDARAKRLRAAAASDPGTASAEAAKDIATYHLGLDMQELPHGASCPIPDCLMFDREAIRRLAESHGRAPLQALSAKELEIAKRLAAGESRKDISKALGRSENTILTHCKRIYARLGVHNRAELTARISPLT